MPEFTLVEGRLSPRYNHFKDYQFYACQATATRMMGVVALKVTWRGIDDHRAKFYQVMHLDYSEYGIDDYYEFECIPGNDDFAENRQDMNHYWKNFVNVMGGRVVNISSAVMLRLIESALPLTSDDIDREYDDDENIRFRHDALERIGLMKEALAKTGVTPESCPPEDAVSEVSPENLSSNAVINYFLMRLVDHDYEAASWLSSIPAEELSEIELTRPGTQTLIRNTISRSSKKTDPPADGKSMPFRCRMTTLARDGYYHSSFVIYLHGDSRSVHAMVSQVEVGSLIKLSDYESALQIAQKEYITIFSCPDKLMDGFDGRNIAPLANAEPVIVPNGWLFTIYNQDNSHVGKSDYRLGDDVFGYALLTIGGEFVLMSHALDRISHLDTSTLLSAYYPQMTLTGRYMLETPVFHTLCQAHGIRFEDLIEPDPEQ